ncbi:MAG TPA: phage portal protein [Phycisphaerae bacterium]
MALATLMLEHFGDPHLNDVEVLARLAWLRDIVSPRLERYLGYYRNPVTELAAALACGTTARFMVRPFRQYQEIGLPARITGFRRGADGGAAATGPVDIQRKEVVIENDIAWRVDTLIDFAAARLPGITSTAPDPARRALLNLIVGQILDSGGGMGGDGTVKLLQELVLQGSICGSAWVHVRPTDELLARFSHDASPPPGPVDAARWLKLEVIDARRVCAWRGYVTILRDAPVGGVCTTDPATTGIYQRVRAWFVGGSAPGGAQEFSFDLINNSRWQCYQHGVLTQEAANPLGLVPWIRYENASDPAAGTRVGPAGSGVVDVGMGDVEPLIGLQDELNTRLSDRANRVTMTSFQMYLGKGIDDFVKRPIGPGQMWATDNLNAGVETFGGDNAAPSEESHINEIREALDKISGVSPVAAGLVRGKLGNLTSAVALRLTLIALLARTERKRANLSRLMSDVVRIALEILNRSGVFKTAPEERAIDVNWPTALPESDMDRLAEAQTKLALGLPRQVVLTELGYGELVNPSKPAPGLSTASPGAATG